MASDDNSQGMQTVEAILMWGADGKGAYRVGDTVLLHAFGLIDWSASDGDHLTSEGSAIKADLHKAQGKKRWEMCRALAKKFNKAIASKQFDLF